MKRILLASIASLVVAAPAYAWPNDPVPAPTATATAAGGAATATGGAATATQRQHQIQRQSQSVTVNNTTAAPTSSGIDPATAARLAAAGAGAHDWQPPAASAIAPSFAVAGPCTGQAASVAGQFQLFGLSFGGTDMDKACQSEHLGNLSTVGERIGFEVMCDDHQFRAAALRAGAACEADRQHQAAVVPATAPAPQAVPDWCLTASPAERRRHSKECKA